MATKRRGDTLIEVLLATVVLSAVLAAAYTLSNRAVKINRLAYERSQVTGYMQTQAELLRAAKNADTDASGELWDEVLSRSNNSAFFDCSAAEPGRVNELPDNPPAGAYHLDTDGNVNNGVVVEDNFYRMWVTSEIHDDEYADFNIFGCWEGADRGINQESGFNVRLEI